MNHKKVKKIIEPLVPRLRKLLCLSEWQVEHLYMSGENHENKDCAMTIDILIPYLSARISIWDRAYTLPDEEVIEAYTHEFCHIYTESLYSIARANANPHLIPFIEEQREQLTERIARLAVKLLSNTKE